MLTSSSVSSIAARELTHMAAVLEGITFRSFEVYFTVTVLDGIMVVLLSIGFTLLPAGASRIRHGEGHTGMITGLGPAQVLLILQGF